MCDQRGLIAVLQDMSTYGTGMEELGDKCSSFNAPQHRPHPIITLFLRISNSERPLSLQVQKWRMDRLDTIPEFPHTTQHCAEEP